MSKNSKSRVTFPEDEFTYEFRKVRGQKTVNPEMRKAIAQGPSKDDKMKFGAGSPDIGNIDARMMSHIRAARDRVFQCPHCNEEHKADYHIVMHRKIAPHIKSRSGSEQDMIDAHQENKRLEARFGLKTISCFHVAAHCKGCNKRIKFVKYNQANRRAAGDFLLMNEEDRSNAPDYLFK